MKTLRILSFRGLLTFLSCILTVSSFSQSITIKGNVTDTNKEPIYGVAITIKNQPTIGTRTDFDGNYEFKGVDANATLVFRSIGAITQEIPVNGRTTINIVLEEDAKLLEELVVVGYSQQRRESLTGALQTLKKDKLKTITTPNAANLLNGKVAGVFVTPGSGAPGSSGKIIIRGKSTINGSVSPLWVVDGVIVGTGPGSLNSDDIETLTVLKDAASTAIYGSEGANGVIIVTTKSARGGDQMRISVSSKFGVSKLSNGNLEVMNGSELYNYFMSFPNNAEIKGHRWGPGLENENFDWWKFATRTGVTQDYNMSITGGSEKVNSLLSLGVYNEKGAVKGGDYMRYTFLSKTNFKLFNGFLTVKPTFSGSIVQSDSKNSHSVGAMYSNLPWDNPYDKDGNIVPHDSPLWYNSNSVNYMYDNQWNYGEAASYNVNGALDFDLRFSNSLSFSSINSNRINFSRSNSYTDPRSRGGLGVKGRLVDSYSTSIIRYTNQILRYRESFGKHSINALVGYEYRDTYYKDVEAIGVGFIPGFKILNATSKPEKAKGTIIESARQSVMMDIHYTYGNKYMGQVLFRRDGASNLGEKSRYGNFGSISGAWNIHNEEFFKLDAVDQLKIRASFGSVGNRPQQAYPHLDLYSISSNYNEVSGSLISQVGNKTITWEKTLTTGVGIDLGLYDRVRFTVDLYNKDISNVLYSVPVSGLTGVTSIWRNVGELSNKGIEVTLGADIIKTKDIIWSIDGNIGLNRNKVVSLYKTNPDSDEVPQIIIGTANIAGAASKILRPGHDADTWFMQEWAGVNPKDGSPQWYKEIKDENGNVIDKEIVTKYEQASRVMTGTATPSFYGGFSSSLKINNFDLNADFGYSVGGKIFNYIRTEYDSDGAYTDRNQIRLNKGWSRWQKEGDNATHPQASYNNTTGANKTSSRYLEDGSYLKLRSLSLGYTTALKSLNISNVRFFVTGENLFCITSFSGIDPEIPLERDVALTSYPISRKLMFGLSLSL